MDMLFNQLKEKKQNTVESIVQIMRESKIVDGNIVTEDRVKQLMSGVGNAADVKIDEFKKMLRSLAHEQKKNVADYVKDMITEGGSFLADAAGSAFRAASRFFRGRQSAKKPDQREVAPEESNESEEHTGEESNESEEHTGEESNESEEHTAEESHESEQDTECSASHSGSGSVGSES